jgi:methyl-accepting chemotaxis protein
MNLNNLRIGTRLGSGFAMVLLLLALMMSAGVWQLRSVSSSLESMMTVQLEKERLSEQWLTSTRLGGMRSMAMSRIEDQNYLAVLTAESKASATQITELIDKIKAMGITDQEQKLLDVIAQARKNASGFRDVVAKARKDGNPEEATRLYETQFAPAAKAYENSILAFRDHQRANFDKAADAIRSGSLSSQRLLEVLGLLALVLGSSAAWALTRSITRPMAQAVFAADAVADGDLTRAVPAEGRDEIATLMNAMARMRASLHQMVSQVRESSDGIHTASSEVASGNLDLSSRTEQAASSLQQAAASMEELTSTMRQSSDSARQASQLASSAAEVASRGGEVVQRVVSTMDDISASSRKITDIIGTIDGIAFQTNILALNAAVEAARAGEQGRGFAVVASEVRSLAGRSADAAKQIKSLISASVEKVEGGSRLVADAGATMQEIVGSVQRVATIIGEITAATGEQTQGMSQVGASVSELDRMTQQNSALVEQSAAAAESLKGQAQQLAQAMSRFRLEAAH